MSSSASAAPRGRAARDRLRHHAGLRGHAALCLAEDFDDLRRRLSRLVVGFDRDGKPVTATDLKAVGALMVLLKDALLPNLVQTIEACRPSSTADRSPTSPTAATR